MIKIKSSIIHIFENIFMPVNEKKSKYLYLICVSVCFKLDELVHNQVFVYL